MIVGPTANVLKIAHRGASGRFAENTLAAFRAAIEAGADACELDVRLSRDGVAMVIHDESVRRTTDGRGRISAMTCEEIQRLNVREASGRIIESERIPALADVLAMARDRCGLDIELKVRGAAAQVCRLLEHYNALESCFVSSFDRAALEEVRRADRRVRLALLIEDRPAAACDMARALGAFAIAPSAELASAELAGAAHRQRLAIYFWTVDDPVAMKRLIALGADGIMTNYPERLVAALRE